MNFLRTIWRRLGAVGKRPAVKREIDEELRFHLDQCTAENIAAGMSPEEAAREARKRFGNLQAVREESREVRGIQWIDNFIQDVRFGFRLWRKQPGSFLLAVTALTLGIGLVTFSLCAINCVFFGKLPFPDADRLVCTSIREPELREFQDQQTTFEGLSAFGSGSANFKAIDAASHRSVCYISANFLDMVRVTPLFGRGFLPNEGKPGADPVALIGYGLWQQEFHGSPAALGSVIRLNGQARTIVGIMPEGFKFPINDELWVPAEPGTAQMSGWGFVFGRLKSSVSMADARTELNLIAMRLAQAATAKAGPLREEAILVDAYTRFENMKGAHGPAPGVMALLVVTLLVLFIACANVAGLTLANATRRGTELAVRGALGATRKRLILQMLIESLIITVGGAAGAVAIIAWLSNWLEGLFASSDAQFSQVPFWMHMQIDGRILLSLIGLILFTNLLAGLWPALQATKRDVNELLKAGTGGTSRMHTGKLQWLLIMVQIAFSAVVLTQSFVLLSYSQRLRQVKLPFDPSSVLTAHVDVPPSADTLSFLDQLERNLAGVSGVQAVALTTSDPASGQTWRQFEIEGKEYPKPEDRPYAGTDAVSTGFFPTLNLSFLQGRSFNASDVAGSLPVAIVNSTFAKTFLPAGNPLGCRFREGTNAWMTVIGCVPDLEYDPSATYRTPTYYVPAEQRPGSSMVILLHGSGRAVDWTKTISTEVAHLQPDLAIYRVATIQTLINHQIIGYYLASLLLGICGGGSLFLATVGIYGLISLSVNQRTREIGVRLALGSTRGRIVTTLLKQAFWQISAGLAVGLLLATALNLVLIHAIDGYPTMEHSVLVFLAAIALLGTISLFAVLIPAMRSARIEPMVALRYE
jgi:putative ABC transport system permease protein